MQTREDVEFEILKLQQAILGWFADLSPYFINAITFDKIDESELPYFRNIDNIIRVCHIDEVYKQQGIENHSTLFESKGFQSPFTFRAIQYTSGYYFIDMYQLAIDYNWEQRDEKELEIEDLYNLIYSLFKFMNF
jgi:hypothetical protein